MKEEELKKIIFHVETYKINREFILLQEDCSIFSVLAREITLRQFEDDTTESMHVQEAIDYIKNNYSRGITVNDIADYLALNKKLSVYCFKKV